MREEIVRLSAAEFEEAMDFLNFVFGEHAPHDFERLLPSIYRRTDEHMANNYAIRRDGAIKAIVGMFPITWRVGDTTLRVAGIGGVSTHPECRGEGLMQRLMQHCVGLMREGRFHLSWLGGQRQRYLHFGYEKCGHALHFTVNGSNIRHCFDDDAGVRFRPVGEDDGDLLRQAKAVHDHQVMHCERPLEDFRRFCVNWHHEPWAAADEDGEFAGYLVADGEGARVSELVAVSSAAALRMVRAWVVERDGKGVSIDVNPLNVGPARDLAEICEQTTIHASGNWQVFEWVEVVDALMKVQRLSRQMPEGSIAVEIEGYGKIRLQVKAGEASCKEAGEREKPHVHCDAATAMRLLFGPLAPSQVAALSKEATGLDAWCPLPLFWARQDGV